MNIVYRWEIQSLKVEDITNSDGESLSNCVCTIDWSYVATREDGEVVYYPGMSNFSAAAVSAEDFVPFENITEELVLSWLQNVIDLDEITEQINIQFSSRKKTMDKPWSTN